MPQYQSTSPIFDPTRAAPNSGAIPVEPYTAAQPAPVPVKIERGAPGPMQPSGGGFARPALESRQTNAIEELYRMYRNQRCYLPANNQSMVNLKGSDEKTVLMDWIRFDAPFDIYVSNGIHPCKIDLRRLSESSMYMKINIMKEYNGVMTKVELPLWLRDKHGGYRFIYYNFEHGVNYQVNVELYIPCTSCGCFFPGQPKMENEYINTMGKWIIHFRKRFETKELTGGIGGSHYIFSQDDIDYVECIGCEVSKEDTLYGRLKV